MRLASLVAASIPAPPLLEEGGTQTTPKLAPLPPPSLSIETQTSPKKTVNSAVSPKKSPVPVKNDDDDDDDEYGSDEDFEDEGGTTLPPPDPRTVTVISSSDAIASTVISLRSTLKSQDETLEEMKSEIAALRTEKKIAVEQAGLAKVSC